MFPHPTMVALEYSSDNFLTKGFELCGFSLRSIGRNKMPAKLARSMDKYYVGLEVISLVFAAIQEGSCGNFQIKKSAKF